VTGALPDAAQLTALVLDPVAKSNGSRKSILDRLARARVSNGILGSFRFDPNGDKTPATFTILRVTGRMAPGLTTDFQGATVDRTVHLQPNLVGP
jgi:ABC-type branched-subunit amino acid transport system substrate-binding protein